MTGARLLASLRVCLKTKGGRQVKLIPEQRLSDDLRFSTSPTAQLRLEFTWYEPELTTKYSWATLIRAGVIHTTHNLGQAKEHRFPPAMHCNSNPVAALLTGTTLQGRLDVPCG